MRIRNQVRILGQLSCMQLLVYLCSQFAADAFHLREILDARPHHAFQSAEPREQSAAPLGADAADSLQRRGDPGLPAARTVTGDRESMGLVPDGLDQVQS